jgi:hypothetical protein
MLPALFFYTRRLLGPGAYYYLPGALPGTGATLCFTCCKRLSSHPRDYVPYVNYYQFRFASLDAGCAALLGYDKGSPARSVCCASSAPCIPAR